MGGTGGGGVEKRGAFRTACRLIVIPREFASLGLPSTAPPRRRWRSLRSRSRTAIRTTSRTCPTARTVPPRMRISRKVRKTRGEEDDGVEWTVD